MQIQSSNHLAKLHQILDLKFEIPKHLFYCVTVFMYSSIVAEIPWQLGSSPEKILGEFLLLLDHLGLLKFSVSIIAFYVSDSHWKRNRD